MELFATILPFFLKKKKKLAFWVQLTEILIASGWKDVFTIKYENEGEDIKKWKVQ